MPPQGELFHGVATRRNMNSLRMARSRAKPPPRPTVTSRRDEAVKSNAPALWQDWMRWRRPDIAVTNFMEELVTPEVLRGLGGSLPVDIGAPGSKPTANPITQRLSIPTGTTPKDMKHELWHYTLQNLSQMAKRGVMPQSLKDLPGKYKLAARVGPQFVGEILSNFGAPALKNYLIDINESGAITFGGASAYPNLTPAFNESAFSDVFRMNNTP